MDDRHQKIREIAERELSYTAHDLAHTERVLRMCLILTKEEPEKNPPAPLYKTSQVYS